MNKLIIGFLFLSLGLSANEYWQQKVNYDIKVELIDSSHSLKAYE